VAKLLLTPITSLTEKLSKMNENFIKPINLKEVPIEFTPLGESINMLINRIQTFVKYQKELFIGTAHELKTPLAVIKLKNEVTLIKKREPEAYIEALNTTNESVNDMNRMVANLLEIGRQEGAQFEKPVTVDVIEVIKKMGEDFQLIAQDQNKTLEVSYNPSAYIALIQVTLLKQIMQNYLQNAMKFTPEGKKVLLQSQLTSKGLEINVIDEGCGIEEGKDLFAPFIRMGDQSGAGLGLFLAKSAADALSAEITISNKKDGSGAIATLVLNSTLTCLLPQ
jgi:two-component system OmpR family sensor kinase